MTTEQDSTTMTNAAIARRAIELVTAFEFEELESLIHEDIVMEAPYQAFHAGPLRRGRASFMEGMSMVPNLFKAFSLNIHALYDCPSEDVVVLEMTSLGVFLAPDPNAKQGGKYQNRYALILQIRDGQIYLWREFFNPELVNANMVFMLGV